MAKQAKVPQININELIDQIQQKAVLAGNVDHENYIPNIIEFCESKKYLNLPSSGVDLFPMQRIILTCFYRGQLGNESLELDDEQIKYLKDNKLDYIFEKYQSANLFRELVLIMGRRAGKNFLTSIIASYETMKLLECSGGDPFKYYGLAPGTPIYVMSVATAAEQATLLFEEIKSKVTKSPYFINKISKSTMSEIYFQTQADKKHNQLMIEQGMETEKTLGSIVIFAGHSNSNSLIGKRVFTLLLDEVGAYKETGGPSSGDNIWNKLTPCTSDFRSKHEVLGKFACPAFDSKIISISSPRGEDGLLFQLWTETPKADARISFKLPTWKVNVRLDELSLRKTYPDMSPNQFAMEYGAEFSGTAGDRFIPEHYINKAQQAGIELNLTQKISGDSRFVYYAHLDPARSSHNYALAIIHIEERIRPKFNEEGGVTQQERYKLFVVDHLKIWQPELGKMISVSQVDEYIIDLAKRFRFAMVSYDDFDSTASVQKLRSRGIPVRITAFRKGYKMRIYDLLETLLIERRIALPFKGVEAELLSSELKYLKRIYSPNGYQIKPDKEAPVNTDDLVDSLTGACGSAINFEYNGYAKGGTVQMPISHSGGEMNEHQWNVGRGSYTQKQWEFVTKKLYRN